MQKAEVPDEVRKYKDFRKLLDEMDDTIDAVIIATPHHTQPTIVAAAMRQNKHVYCEKPIAHDVGEAGKPSASWRMKKAISSRRWVIKAWRPTRFAGRWSKCKTALSAKSKKRINGMQPAASRILTTFVRSRQIHHRSQASWIGICFSARRRCALTIGSTCVGPAGDDYGTGMLGMGGAHSCHMTFNALNFAPLWEGNGGNPNTIRVEAECSDDEKDRFPNWEVVKFHFPARGAMPPAKLTWAKGMPEDLQRLGITPEMEKTAGRTLDWGADGRDSGSLLIGSKGMVHTNMHNSECALLPLDRFPDQSGQPKRLPHAGSHEREWVNACRGEGPKPFSNFDYAGPIIELLLLGNICTLLGRPIEYDPASGKIVNDEQANGELHPKRREGWELT